jgi:hypothetical protein
MNREGFGRKLSWHKRIYIEALWKTKKIIRIIGAATEIRTEHLQNPNLERYDETAVFCYVKVVFVFV